MVDCESQEEDDRYWSRLADGGQEIACSWVSDIYGLSWQIVPRGGFVSYWAIPIRNGRSAMAEMLAMTKIEVDELERAAAAA